MDNDIKSILNIKKIVIKLIISFLILAALLVGAYFVLKAFGLTNLSQEDIQTRIEEYGAWGPLIFTLLSFLQVTFIPIPSTITILAGAYLFGVFESWIYSFIGIFIGSIFAFFLGRKIGRPFVNWVIGDKELVSKYLNAAKGKELVVFSFMFIMPLFPDDALCTLAGITPITYKQFIVMQVIARNIAIGATMLFLTGFVIPHTWWGYTILGVGIALVIVLLVLCFKYSDKIIAFGNKLLNKIKGKEEHE